MTKVEPMRDLSVGAGLQTIHDNATNEPKARFLVFWSEPDGPELAFKGLRAGWHWVALTMKGAVNGLANGPYISALGARREAIDELNTPSPDDGPLAA